MIERVPVQKNDGEFATVNGRVGWFGLAMKAHPVSFFEWPERRDGGIARSSPGGATVACSLPPVRGSVVPTRLGQ